MLLKLLVGVRCLNGCKDRDRGGSKVGVRGRDEKSEFKEGDGSRNEEKGNDRRQLG